MTPTAGKRGWSTSSSLVGKDNGGCFDSMVHSALIIIMMIINILMTNAISMIIIDDDDPGRQRQRGVLRQYGAFSPDDD